MCAQRDAPGADVTRFRAYLAEDWAAWLDEYPELATSVGAPGRNDRWTDDSPSGIDRRKEHLARSIGRLDAFDGESFPAAERLNVALYRDCLHSAREGLEFGDDPMPFRFGSPRNLWMPLNQMEGVHLAAADAAEQQPRSSVTDFEDRVRRLRALPAAIGQAIALLREGLRRGYSPARVAIHGVPTQVEGLAPPDPPKSPLLEAFGELPPRIPPEEQRRLRGEAEAAYREEVRPAVAELHRFLVDAYLPACRESIAASDLPNGARAYSRRVRWQTTTDLSPQEIHEIGLREVRRIRAAMSSLAAAAGHPDDLPGFTQFLRTDPRFFFRSGEDLVESYRAIAKRIDPRLAGLFGRLPRLPYGVIPVPAFRAPSSPAAYYQPGAPATGRAGYFNVNTHAVGARPKWEMEALALHEAVPGHHLQLALAQELADRPEFRQFSGPTAFIEGWGLYAESLGDEVGCYGDSFSRWGQLDYDMWRSIRLVVDTGMHAMGWTRDQAIAFFRENSGKSDVDTAVEVDRYIVWPAQALAYKIGQLKFRELRTYAEQQLGDRFEVRAFHDKLLEEGALPMGEVDRRLRAWVGDSAATP